MKNVYRGKNALHYNQDWHTFTDRTLAQVLSSIKDFVHPAQAERQQRLRVLDIACGTGTLLKRITEYIPDVEHFGIDASPDMLTQAKQALAEQPCVHLERIDVGLGEETHFPYAPESFDIITCTNSLHLMQKPVETLLQFRTLLKTDGFLIVEDYARRQLPFPWPLFEFILRHTEEMYVRTYTLTEVRELCTQADLQSVEGHAFSIDWLWHGWVITLQKRA